jgi:hypothetical protein
VCVVLLLPLPAGVIIEERADTEARLNKEVTDDFFPSFPLPLLLSLLLPRLVLALFPLLPLPPRARKPFILPLDARPAGKVWER